MKWYLHRNGYIVTEYEHMLVAVVGEFDGMPAWEDQGCPRWQPKDKEVHDGPLPLPEEVDTTLIDWTGFERKYYARGRWQYEQDVPGSDFFVCADPFGPDGMWTVGTNDEQVFPVANEARANRLAWTLVAVLGPATLTKETYE